MGWQLGSLVGMFAGAVLAWILFYAEPPGPGTPAVTPSMKVLLFLLAAIGAIVWAKSVPGFLSKSWQSAGSVALLFLFMALISPFAAVREERKKRTEQRRREIAPCQHGIRGAYSNPSLCEPCALRFETMRREAEADSNKKRAEAAARDEAERVENLRKRAEFAEQVRALSFLAAMDPMDFQRFSWLLYQRLGYVVTETPTGRDGGVDGFLEKDGKRFLLQCKRFQGDVGEPVLRDLYGTVHHHGADGAILVTTGRVSTHARNFCEGKPIEIVDGKVLVSQVDSANLTADVIPDSWVGGITPKVLREREKAGWLKTCPKCGAQTRKTSTPNGRSWVECYNSPRCDYRWQAPRPGRRRWRRW